MKEPKQLIEDILKQVTPYTEYELERKPTTKLRRIHKLRVPGSTEKENPI